MIKPILIDLPMPIVTPRLILRPPRPGDGKTLNEAVLASFDNLHATMPWAKARPTVEESEEFVRLSAANWILKKDEEPYLPLFIYNKEGQFIGATGFHHINWDVPSLEIGYWLHTTYSGQGYMTEAVNAQAQYAIKQLNVKRIAITCDVDNMRSRNVAERLGFQLEGTLESHRVQPITSKISNTLIFARYDLEGLPELMVSWG